MSEGEPMGTRVLPIDLRGLYRPNGVRIYVAVPEDLATHKLRVSEAAIAATPTWGTEGVDRYRRAIQTATEQGR